MLINSAVLGEVEISDEDIFNVPDGFYGFDGNGKYALITKVDEDVTLRWFQPVEAQVPCFVVFDPGDILLDYRPILEPSDLRALEASNIGELEFLTIAVVPENIRDITVNLKSPIAINRRKGIARQVILRNTDYPIRFPLVEDEDEFAAAAQGE